MSGKRRVPVLTSGTISASSGVNSYIAVHVDDYLSASIEMISNSASSLAVIFEVSNDAVGDAYTGAWDGTSGTWKTVSIQRTNSSTTESTLTISADVAYGWNVSLGWRWFRVRCTSVTSGSTTWYIKPQYEPISYLPSTTSTATATITGGQAAHDAAVSGNPVRVSGRAKTSNYTAVADNDTADLVTSTVGALIMKSYSIPELDWSYAAASGGISNTTTAVTIKAAAGAGIRNYITAIQISADALGAATEIAVRDGAGGTVLLRQKITTAGLAPANIIFPSPLKSTANTLLEVVTLTATVTGAVYFNAQGYTAP